MPAARRLEIAPFRALRYESSGGPGIGRLIAPPYDVISPAERERLAGEPHNIVHLDLPAAEADQSRRAGAASGTGGDPYAGAADRLRAWIRAGVLARDPRPALYLFEQRYRDPEGRTRTRRGLFARLRLEALDSGVIIPHERTLERPRVDRERLLAATRAHLSAVFLVHQDPSARVAGLLSERGGVPSILQDGGASDGWRLARLEDPALVDRLAEMLGDQFAVIADGHHRYESALAYREARRAAGRADAEHVLACLVSLEDEGLEILPIHRLVHSLRAFDPTLTRASLQRFFDLRDAREASELPALLRGERGKPGAFGLLFGDGRVCLARWKPGAGLDRPNLRSVPPPLRDLDVILLHRLVFEEVLGIDLEAQARQDNLDYVKDERALMERSREAQIGVLMNPTRLDQVIAVSRAGIQLPQKTTYFYPKVPSGLVIDLLDD